MKREEKNTEFQNPYPFEGFENNSITRFGQGD